MQSLNNIPIGPLPGGRSGRVWKKHARPSMRQIHIGGEKVVVDFADDTINASATARGTSPMSLAARSPSSPSPRRRRLQLPPAAALVRAAFARSHPSALLHRPADATGPNPVAARNFTDDEWIRSQVKTRQAMSFFSALTAASGVEMTRADVAVRTRFWERASEN
ncbi:MAG: hypothetical protein EKK35_14410 [Bradyrhizobiaceae bacterium]|jgi:hypothetical protein|nr:MAG: hypothetical protein EKK35_14410 [Bradyrhizobiaceae bacterium]